MDSREFTSDVFECSLTPSLSLSPSPSLSLSLSPSLSLSQACRDDLCVNLSPQYISEKKHTGLFNGDPYVTWDVKVGLTNIKLIFILPAPAVRMC